MAAVPISSSAEVRMDSPPIDVRRRHMPEKALFAEGKSGVFAAFTGALLQDCYSSARSGERQQRARRGGGELESALGEECVADDFRLLLKAIAAERAAVVEDVGIAAERVAHQRQIEAAAGLRLPDVGHF